MCKTCGCSDGSTLQLELVVREANGLQSLCNELAGEPGILHIHQTESHGRLILDFNSQRTTQQAIETFIIKRGYSLTSSSLCEMKHQHGVFAFLKRIAGKNKA